MFCAASSAIAEPANKQAAKTTGVFFIGRILFKVFRFLAINHFLECGARICIRALVGRHEQGSARRPCRMEASNGETAPSWKHLRNADEIGLPEFSHSVERFDRDGNFGHAASVFARLQGVSDDALVATDRRFLLVAGFHVRRLKK